MASGNTLLAGGQADGQTDGRARSRVPEEDRWAGPAGGDSRRSGQKARTGAQSAQQRAQLRAVSVQSRRSTLDEDFLCEGKEEGKKGTGRMEAARGTYAGGEL